MCNARPHVGTDEAPKPLAPGAHGTNFCMPLMLGGMPCVPHRRWASLTSDVLNPGPQLVQQVQRRVGCCPVQGRESGHKCSDNTGGKDEGQHLAQHASGPVVR